MKTEKHIVLLTSHAHRGEHGDWEPGDQLITEGLFRVLPELNRHHTTLIKSIPLEEQDLVIKNCDYVIQAGTPGWMHPSFRRNWESCKQYNKRIAFLGIGLAVPYEADFWYGREDFTYLKDSGLIDVIVCRDKYALYWIKKKVGFEGSKITSLPCPAFYMMDEDPSGIHKKKVVFSIANIDECSHANIDTFKNYYGLCKETIEALLSRSAEVSVSYMRSFLNHPVFIQDIKQLLGEIPLVGFTTPKEFKNFHRDKHVYIGVRNHGALPMAGAGKPALLLGTDYRQKLTGEIPFLSTIDISYSGINPREILDWYDSLSPHGVSQSLLEYRRISYKKWREVIAPVIEVLQP